MITSFSFSQDHLSIGTTKRKTR